MWEERNNPTCVNNSPYLDKKEKKECLHFFRSAVIISNGCGSNGSLFCSGTHTDMIASVRGGKI